MAKPKTITFHPPLFNCSPIHLVKSKEEAAAFFKWMKVGEWDFTGYQGFQTKLSGKNGLPVIVIGVFDAKVATLAHECCHAAFEVCNIVGVPTPNDGMNETFCYLVQRMVEHFQKHLTGGVGELA